MAVEPLRILAPRSLIALGALVALFAIAQRGHALDGPSLRTTLDGFHPVSIDAPAFSTDGTRMVHLRAFEREKSRVVSFCAATDLSEWSEDALPFVVSMAEGLFAKIVHSAGLPDLHRVGERHGNIEIVEYVGEGAKGRVFLTFADIEGASALLSCGIACADAAECDSIVSNASVDANLRPKPPPSFFTNALHAMVHHPATTAALFALFLAVFGVWAIVARKRTH